MTRILIVDDDRTQAEEFATLLRGSGCEVTLAGNGKEATDLLRLELPDVVLTDLDMPVIDGLELVRTIRREYPALPVILMTATGTEAVAAKALHQGAASYVRKRSLAKEVVRTVSTVLAVARALPKQERVLDCLTDGSFAFVLDNDLSQVAPVLGLLDQVASLLHPGDPIERIRIGIALNEALLNAMQHGNLELSSDLRQDDERIFRELGEQRRQESPYRQRRVRVRATLSCNEAVYVVEDEGPGFDPATVPDPTDAANLERIGGRGLMLIRTFMDEVEHNERGNRIILRKRYSAVGPPAATDVGDSDQPMVLGNLESAAGV
jgi:CheY-like chemotaxis protein/anti-sigma regulatory factor (Ser/Thr protein kinase)